MKLLLDHGLPRSAAARLRAGGFDAVHAGDSGLAAASDAEVLDAARRQGRTVVTLDADFHAILALSDATGPSVVRIRIEGLRAEALSNLVATVLSRCGDDLTAGALVSVTEDQIRVRRLPISPKG
jgi:predicted nuclease of predicted toxin-antitoxin system